MKFAKEVIRPHSTDARKKNWFNTVKFHSFQVATSGIQYGLYQSDSFQHVPYDRSELHINRPRHIDNYSIIISP